ncbi:hypothetical protein [Undibacterium umbellatum]|uniref:Uncharacterized protein n=1 Tax=Undibacterium umbellatum TaxID=2762300 RepID=A0ABR6ZIS3_9BURK|nr:hypothetical protein [Undibacterium umbellatum]MBC3911245.1 hypothetical protein [Undibacterium umbellatum]
MNKSVPIITLGAAVLATTMFFGRSWHSNAAVPASPTANVVTASSASIPAVSSTPDELIFMAGNEDHSGLQAAPEAEKFSTHLLEDPAALSQYLTPAQHKQTLATLKNKHCLSPKITLYSKLGMAEKLLVSDCYYLKETGDGNVDPYYDTSYGIMLSVTLGGVFELKGVKNMSDLYETSALVAVTNLKKDGHLQLWLDADICEPAMLEAGAIATPENCKTTGIIDIANAQMQVTKK